LKNRRKRVLCGFSRALPKQGLLLYFTGKVLNLKMKETAAELPPFDYIQRLNLIKIRFLIHA